MSAERPNHPTPSASVLIVGLTTDVVEQVSKALAPRGLEARATALARLRADTEQHKPIIVLVDAYLYDFDPSAFDKLAVEVGAKLGVVSNAKEALGLLETILQAAPPNAAPPKPPAKQSAPRREFVTAKYDAKTLHEALERMGAKRPEFDTARYDAKTLRKALENMSSKRLDSETSQYDATALAEVLEEMKSTRSPDISVDQGTALAPTFDKDADTGTYDAAKLMELLDRTED